MEELARRQKGDNARAEGDAPVSSRKAAGYVAYAAAGRHSQTVGYLCGDMGDVVAAAPADAIMVVSEMGEQWSPRAAVAREPPAAFELSVHQLAVGFGAARPCDYHDEGARQGEKDDDADVESGAHVFTEKPRGKVNIYSFSPLLANGKKLTLNVKKTPIRAL